MQVCARALRAQHRNGREPRFVTNITDFLHAVGYASRTKTDSAVRANEFRVRCHFLDLHRTLPPLCVPLRFRFPLSDCSRSSLHKACCIKLCDSESTNTVFAPIQLAQILEAAPLRAALENLDKITSLDPAPQEAFHRAACLSVCEQNRFHYFHVRFRWNL